MTVTDPIEGMYIGHVVFNPGQKKKIPVVIEPKTACQTTLGWWSGDETIITVNENGVATAHKPGKTIVGCGSTGTFTTYGYITVKPIWKRLWGQTALDTGKAIVEADGVFKAKRGGTVLVATADGYRDALAAAGLAGVLDAPVLITPGKTLARQTSNEIKRLKPRQIIVVGGPLAVSNGVMSQLKKLCPKVTRVAGTTATGTAQAIWKKGGKQWGKTAIVATSNGFSDALSVAPYAFAKKAPIFLANPSDKTSGRVLSSGTIAAIKRGGFTRVVIVGGRLAVDGKVEQQLKKAGVKTVKRLAGGSATETSVAIAKWELGEGMGVSHAAVASATGYKDALMGAALCGKQNSVLLLYRKDSPWDYCDFLYNDDETGRWTKVKHGHVLGGSAVVPEVVLGLLTR